MKVFWIDLFAGAGGTSTGIEKANANAQVIACVNHDANAIAAHKANHPNCEHFTEDIRDFAVVLKLKKLVEELRAKYPDCIINIWASLECTNYSKAKGGLPRKADSRTLAKSLYMQWDNIKKKHIKGDSYIQILKPDYIYIENVREFMAWGPLDKDGKPISTLNGRDYLRWRNKINSFDFNHEHRILNSADFGAVQARERYFGIFARTGLPISFPQPTHYDPRKKKSNGLFDFNLKPWRAVKNVLELDIEGQSIFTRKKELSENTLKRIYAGLIKFVANGETKFRRLYTSFTQNFLPVYNHVFLRTSR